MMLWSVFMHLVNFLVFPIMTKARFECSQVEYDRCIRLADPLVKEAHLIFPDNINDIDLVCRTWNRFVDCLKTYTDYCFTDQQRQQFNKAVENPIESVHQMCMQPNYQKEYLHYAPCIKSTITERNHCGSDYNLLVDQVSQGDIISKSTLCCSHDRFKQCVQRETRRLCDRGALEGPASRFSTQIIDKALSFLQDQCLNYIPNSGDCATLTTDSLPSTDSLSISSSSSEVYPWSTVQEAAPKAIEPSKVTSTKLSTVQAWLPSSILPIDTSQSVDGSSTSTKILGSRSRPASYGRSNTWLESSSPGNTIQMFPELSTTPQPTPNFRNQNQKWKPDFNEAAPSTWYPAAGSQLVNEVDEPNQQGLTKPKNGDGNSKTGSLIILIGTFTFIFMAT